MTINIDMKGVSRAIIVTSFLAVCLAGASILSAYYMETPHACNEWSGEWKAYFPGHGWHCAVFMRDPRTGALVTPEYVFHDQH